MATDLLTPEYRNRTLVFFALGGGGVRTLEGLLHLCGLGLGPRSLRVLAVDPDEANGSVGRMLQLLYEYRAARAGLGRDGGAPEGFFRTEVELLVPDIPVWSPLAADRHLPDARFSASVDRALMGQESGGLDILFDLLYSRRVREMDLSAGFRGLPSVGAVFMNRLVSEPVFAELLTPQAKAGDWLFFAAGSLFGGTGASALPAIPRALRAASSTGWKHAEVRGVPRRALGAALLLPYFTAPASAQGPQDGLQARAYEHAGALSGFLNADEPGYGAYYLLGDSRPRELEEEVAGGSRQCNPAHYVELFAALAALDFASRGGEAPEGRLPIYRGLGVGDVPGWDDLPLAHDSRSALRSAVIAMHVFLTTLRPGSRGWSGVAAELTGVTWAESLRLGRNEWEREAPLLDAVHRFWTGTRRWLAEMRRGRPPLRLIAAERDLPYRVHLPGLVEAAPGHPVRDDVFTVFRHWNLEAHHRRGGGLQELPAVMRLGTLRYERERLADARFDAAPGPLHPLLPSDAGRAVGSLAPGRWSALDPSGLARRPPAPGASFTDPPLPSPWARMLLFRNAMRDPGHPARTLVENEILDALELIWSSNVAALPLDLVRIRPDTLAEMTPSPRALGVAEALAAEAPRSGGDPAPAVITVVVVGRQPVIASSPYTVVFTAADAADAAADGFPYLFRHAQGQRARPLHERPLAFQRYVAGVLLPQLRSDVVPDWEAGASLAAVTAFLHAAVQHARGVSSRAAAALELPADWREAADRLDLSQLSIPFGAVHLYAARRAQFSSRWMLRPGRASGATPPLVLVPGVFDGVYGEGLPSVRLPDALEQIDRAVLPVTKLRYPWVSPEDDWLTERLLPLARPLDSQNAVGAELYRAGPSVRDAPFAQAQLALPLTAEFFRWFRPEDVPKMLSVEVPRPGEVVVTLEVPVGTEHGKSSVYVRRVYSGPRIERLVGPEVAVWPCFAAADWNDYAVFRLDRHPLPGGEGAGLQLRAFSAGEPLEPLGHTQRTDVASTYAYSRVPEVLELRATDAGDRPQPLGVIIPRYRPARPIGDEAWRVGVDMGAENTTIAILRSPNPVPELLAFSPVALPLTDPGPDLPYYLGTYFVPEQIPPEPFATAVVYQVEGRAYPRELEPVALNANLMFSGLVATNERNRVVTGEKLGARGPDYKVAESALRTIAMLVLAAARAYGVAPSNVTFAYGADSTLSMSYTYNLRQLWKTALAPSAGATEAPPAALEMHHGFSVIDYFSRRGVVTPEGAPSVIFDVGGSSTALASCGHGQLLALDSLFLAGRHLTGATPIAHDRGEFSNAFVRAFVRWARGNGLPPSQAAALAGLAKERHDALAFRQLVNSRWFELEGADRFRTTAEHERFGAVLFYFFGAFCHFAGLLSRAVQEDPQTDPLWLLAFAGNGSRFLHWLYPSWEGSAPNPVRDALLRVFHSAAGEPDSLPRILVSSEPKQEVARGLVTVQATELSDLKMGTVVGESLAVAGDASRTFDATTRVSTRVALNPLQVRWPEQPLEIERFHEALVDAARAASSQGPKWVSVGPLEHGLERISRNWIQGAAHVRLEQLWRNDEQVPGNLFAVEAAAVVEQLVEVLFGE